jgi:pantothenate kinase-related protein Tda10
MANGDVLKTIQRLLDKPETTLPANVTAQLLFAAIIELTRRLDSLVTDQQNDARNTASWRSAIEDRLETIEHSAISMAQLDAERDKVRVTIPAIFERIIQPVIVSLITAIVVGAILASVVGGP